MEETKEQLIKIMESYKIGKKPLAKLLGWGETTVINQLKGAQPGREFAEKIDEISKNPYLFSEILEENRDKITEVAYRKARHAIDETLIRDKAAHIIIHLAESVNCDTAPYQLVATLFYSQAASLILYGTPIIDDDILYKPRNYMPYPAIYAKLIKDGLHAVRNGARPLNTDDSELVSAIHKLLNGYSPNAVKTLLKEDRNALLSRHKLKNATTETELTEGVQISLTEFHEYCIEENKSIGISDIKGFRKYFDEKLKQTKKNKG